jgi:hypothetical protein
MEFRARGSMTVAGIDMAAAMIRHARARTPQGARRDIQ